MHDLDRALMELEHEGQRGFGGGFADDFSGEFESGDVGFGDTEMEGAGGALDQGEEMEMASDLLTVSNEAELEQFLGKLFKKITRKVGGLLKTPVGRALGGVLKQVASKALPIAGGAIGTALLPGIGTAAGGMVGDMAGKMFGMELEGLSPEDQELEAAKRFVRLAADATANAARSAASGAAGSAADVARRALVAAAQQHAPGLLRGPRGNGAGGGQSGRWVRKGNRIILYGV